MDTEWSKHPTPRLCLRHGSRDLTVVSPSRVYRFLFEFLMSVMRLFVWKSRAIRHLMTYKGRPTLRGRRNIAVSLIDRSFGRHRLLATVTLQCGGFARKKGGLP